MKELDNKALQEYLKNAIDLETDVETQKRILAYSEKHANETQPQKAPTYTVTEPQWADEKPFQWWMILVALATGIVTLPIILFFCKKQADEARAHNAKLRENYQDSLDKANTLNRKNQETFAREYPLWKKTTEENRAVLQKPLAESQALLEKLYASDVIFPKYRNLPALTSISEYLITGRCDSLTGPHGAYNLYEEELRQDTIIAQLNVVIRNLEQIKQNQYLLYEQVSQINRVAQGVYSELRQIKNYSASIAASSALTAYYAGRNERHNRISMYCDLLD